MGTTNRSTSALSIRVQAPEQAHGTLPAHGRKNDGQTDHSPRLNQRTWHATYVLYEHIRDYLALGWMVAIPNAACHVNAYGVVMEWRCNCKIARPAR